MKWIKASERLPANSDLVFLKFGINLQCAATAFWEDQRWWYSDGSLLFADGGVNVIWLDESVETPPESHPAIGVEEFAQSFKHEYRNEFAGEISKDWKEGYSEGHYDGVKAGAQWQLSQKEGQQAQKKKSCEGLPVLLKRADGVTLDGIQVTFATKQIREVIELYFESNDKMNLPASYTYEIVPSSFYGKVAKISMRQPLPQPPQQ